MNADALINSMERFAAILPTLIDGLSDHDLRWRPDDESWSILEILCHLADEETEDFRTRLRMILMEPEKEWPKIDPEGVAVSRSYNEQSPAEALGRFLEARRVSITWLRGLDNPNWDQTHPHPRVGPVPAGEMLISWASHDALHLRQIAKRLYQLIQRDGAPFDSHYAGKWTA